LVASLVVVVVVVVVGTWNLRWFYVHTDFGHLHEFQV
jgi:hypothetical protein